MLIAKIHTLHLARYFKTAHSDMEVPSTSWDHLHNGETLLDDDAMIAHTIADHIQDMPLLGSTYAAQLPFSSETRGLHLFQPPTADLHPSVTIGSSANERQGDVHSMMAQHDIFRDALFGQASSTPMAQAEHELQPATPHQTDGIQGVLHQSVPHACFLQPTVPPRKQTPQQGKGSQPQYAFAPVSDEMPPIPSNMPGVDRTPTILMKPVMGLTPDGALPNVVQFPLCHCWHQQDRPICFTFSRADKSFQE